MATSYVRSRIPPSTYAKRLGRLRRRIFGDVVRTTDDYSMKVTRLFSEMPREEDEFFVTYYPPHPMFFQLSKMLRLHGLFRDEHQDFKEEMDRLRALRGKVKQVHVEGRTTKLMKTEVKK